VVARLLMLRLSRSVNSLAGLFNESQVAWNQADLHIVVLPSGTKKDVIFNNEPEKLLKKKGETTWVAKSEPENEAEKLLKTGSCGKNEPKTNRKTNRTGPCY